MTFVEKKVKEKTVIDMRMCAGRSDCWFIIYGMRQISVRTEHAVEIPKIGAPKINDCNCPIKMNG